MNVATYVLIHGAGSDSGYWHLVVAFLEAAGHDVVAVDLPCDDDSAGLEEYAQAVIAAVGDRTEVVLVAQSLGGFTPPLVCDRLAAQLLILVAAMVPRPGEAPGEWWANTGHQFPDPFDPAVVFTHDLPGDLAAASLEQVRELNATVVDRRPDHAPKADRVRQLTARQHAARLAGARDRQHADRSVAAPPCGGRHGGRRDCRAARRRRARQRVQRRRTCDIIVDATGWYPA